jgi:hypothetical protein
MVNVTISIYSIHGSYGYRHWICKDRDFVSEMCHLYSANSTWLGSNDASRMGIPWYPTKMTSGDTPFSNRTVSLRVWLGSKIPRENLWNPMFTTISPPYPHQIHQPTISPHENHHNSPENSWNPHKKNPQFPAAREEASHERSIKFTSWGWNAKMWGYMAWDNRLTIQYWGRMGILGYFYMR